MTDSHWSRCLPPMRHILELSHTEPHLGLSFVASFDYKTPHCSN